MKIIRFSPALPVLSMVCAMLLLTGCPQSKLPDPPSTVPQPKALVLMGQASFEI